MIKNPFAGKSTRTKTFAVITLVALILLLGLNLAAFAMGVYDTVFLDLTSEGLYTVRDMMVEACHDVFYLEDGSLVMGNLMNAAHALGLGSCWIHRAKQTFELPAGKELLAKWGLPENLIGIGNCILGFEAEAPAEKPRKEGRIIKV